MSDFTHLEAYLDQLCHQHPSIGITLTMVREATIEYAYACGHYGEQPLTLDTPLAVASLSKPVFAYTVLKLSERGVLDLDKPLAQYLPYAYLPSEPYVTLMTARHALSHTTGFPNWRDETGLRASFCPGSAFHYSTEGLLYLQTVVEYLTQQPLLDYMQENIFTPFGMVTSRLVPEDLSAWRPDLPGGMYGYGALSLCTTATDYARFLIEILQPGKADVYHLDLTTLAQMLTPHIQVGDQEQLFWGLGWGIQRTESEDSFWHFGAKRLPTFNFTLGYPAEQTGLVILTSQSIGFSLCEDIARIALASSKPLPAFQWLLPPERWRADGRQPAVQDSGAG